MDRLGTGYSEPVRSLQSFMRKISEHYPMIPPIIPDGIFGVQTRATVRGFQQYFGLVSTGEADNETWDKMLEIYDEIIQKTREPKLLKMFPSTDTVFAQGVRSEQLFAVQGILLAITRHFSNLGSLMITGVHDEPSAGVVQRLQATFGLPVTGVLDILTWESIQRLYEGTVMSTT